MTTQIAEYSKTDAALADLAQRYKDVVFDVLTRDGMATAIKGRAELRTYYVDLEKLRVKLKAPALERCRLIDSDAKQLDAELRSLHDPIDEQIKKEGARKENEKAAKIEAERVRVERIQAALQDIRQTGAGLNLTSGAAVIEAVLAGLKATPVDEGFAEFRSDADRLKVQQVIMLHKLHGDALEYEEIRRKAKADADELARLKADEERRQREAAAVAAEVARKREAEERAHRERIAAEEQAAADRIAAQARVAQAARDEADRKAREALAAQEAAAKTIRDAEEARLAAERRAIEDAARAHREAQEARDRAARERNEMAMQEIRGIQQQAVIAQMGRLGVREGGTLQCLEDTLAETEAWQITAENFGLLAKPAQAAKDAAIEKIRGFIAEWRAREKLQAEHDAREAAEREQKRRADELLSARDMLVTFRHRYADLAEFAAVHAAIDSYMSGKKPAAKPAKSQA